MATITGTINMILIILAKLLIWRPGVDRDNHRSYGQILLDTYSIILSFYNVIYIYTIFCSNFVVIVWSWNKI